MILNEQHRSDMPRLSSQSGVTLTEMLLSLVIGAIIISFVASLFFLLAKLQVKQQIDFNFSGFRSSIVGNLESQCAWSNTIKSQMNSTLSCLNDGTCTNGQEGTLYLVQEDNTMLYPRPHSSDLLIRRDGEVCSTEQAMAEGTPNSAGNCDTSFKLRYKVLCTNDCANPQIKLFGDFTSLKTSTESTTANVDKWDFTYIKNHQRIYRTCQAARDAGETSSGLEWLDPDGAGGVCPEPVYCDQGDDGGGWALVVSATTHGYNELPVISPPLLRSDSGRLPNAFISALLANSSSSTSNNIRVRVNESSAGHLVVAQRVSQPSGPADSISSNPVCSSFDTTVHNAELVSASAHSFFSANGSASAVGFAGRALDIGPSVEGDAGFHCLACGDVTTCGLAPTACCQKQLPGSVWVR